MDVRRVLFSLPLLLLLSGPASAIVSLATDPRVDPSRFQMSEFATGLAYPTSLVELDDGSLLLLTNDPSGGNLFASTGEISRLVDADGDGVADGPPQLLYTGLAGIATSMKRMGPLLAVSSKAFDDEQIQILRLGSGPGDPLTLEGVIDFQFPPYPSDSHRNVGLASRAVAGVPGSYELFFNIGSETDNDATAATFSAAGLLAGVPGATSMQMDSVYRVTLQDTGATPVLSALEQVAGGLRNAAGLAFDPRPETCGWPRTA